MVDGVAFRGVVMGSSRRHRLIICVDIERFSRLSDTWQAAARKGMYEALRCAFDACGVSAEYDPADRGDGALLMLSADVAKDDLLTRLPGELTAELARHNAEVPQAQIRMRVAVHCGEVDEDDHGFVGDAVNKVFRLSEATPLKEALAASPGTVAVIVSEEIYRDVIRHIPAARPEMYQRTGVKVKETDTEAWICLPDAPDFLREFVDWAAEDHRFQAWLHHTTEQQIRHAKTGHAGDLLAGTSLTEGLEWARQRPLPHDITAYLDASYHHQQTIAHRARSANIIFANVFAAQRHAQSRRLAAQSENLLITNPELAALLAVQAYRVSPTAESIDILRTAAALPLYKPAVKVSGSVESVAFSPGGDTLAIATGGGDLHLWNVSDGKEHDIPDKFRSMFSVAFSADGESLAVGGTDGVQLRNIANGTCRPVPGISGSVYSAAFSPDGETLAIANADGKAWLWNMSSRVTRPVPGISGSVESLAFSAVGEALAIGGGGGTWLLDIPSDKLCHFSGINFPVFSVAFSPDGETLAIGGDNGVQLRNIANDGTCESAPEISGPVYSVAFSPDGKTLAIANTTDGAWLWNISSGTPHPVPGISDTIYSVAFSPDGKTLAIGSGSDDDTVRGYDDKVQWRTALFRDAAEAEAHIRQVVPRDLTPEERSRFLES